MRALLQRVKDASVEVEGKIVGQIGRGFLVLAAAGVGDSEADVDRLSRKIAEMRVFPDEEGRFNRSILDTNGEILLISQFTLYADCRKGRRPSFLGAAPPAEASPLIDAMAQKFRAMDLPVATGVFGAMMQVRLTNDGPVTIWLDTADWGG